MIPTAKEYFKGTFQNIVLEKHCEKIKEFAKLHVEAALEEASKKAKIIHIRNTNEYEINEDSILDAYPLDNIK